MLRRLKIAGSKGFDPKRWLVFVLSEPLVAISLLRASIDCKSDEHVTETSPDRPGIAARSG
jgi:hypothetical protein